MFRVLNNRDEYADQTKVKDNSLHKIDKKVEKQLRDEEKPIHPKYIFEKQPKNTKKLSSKKYRKPKPDPESNSSKLITINDFGTNFVDI